MVSQKCAENMEFRLIFRSFEILRMFCKTCLCPTVNNSNLLYCTVQSRRIMATDLIFPLGITGPDLISSWNYFLHCIRIISCTNQLSDPDPPKKIGSGRMFDSCWWWNKSLCSDLFSKKNPYTYWSSRLCLRHSD